MIEYLDQIMATFSDVMWSMPLVITLIASGIFFTLYSKMAPFRYLGHAVEILRGKFDSEDDPGQITHFEALSSALASTVGMGNIAGVAVAISLGGAGATFWMFILERNVHFVFRQGPVLIRYHTFLGDLLL